MNTKWIENGDKAYGNMPLFVPSEGLTSIFSSTATQEFALGLKMELSDGRWFRYAKNGGVALTRALMTQSMVVDTHYDNEVQTAYPQAVGATDITILCTTGGLATAPDWSGGTLVVNDTASDISPFGDIYKIKVSQQTSETLIKLTLETPIRNAILATAEITLMPNKYYKVVVHPTSATGVPTGVPLCDVPIGYYFWSQTKGDAPIIVDGGETIVAGNMVGLPGTAGTAGCAGVWQTLFDPWGRVRNVAAAGDVALIDLMVD